MHTSFLRFIIALFSSLILCVTSYGAVLNIDPVLDADEEDDGVPIVQTKLSAGTVYTPMFVDLGNDGSTQANAYVAYIPIATTPSAIDQKLHNVYLTETPTSTSTIAFTLDVLNQNSGDTQYLYYAVEQDDGTWKVAFKYATPFASSSSDDYSREVVEFPLSSISSTLNSLDGGEDTFDGVFFLDDNNLADGGTVDPDDYTSVLYYSLEISGRVPSSLSARVSLDSLAKGDGRLKIGYTGITQLQPYEAVIFSYNASNATENSYSAAIAAGGTFINDRSFAACSDDEQTINLNDLANGTTYHIAVGCLDKFKYVTLFTASQEETPQAIDTFLDESACYMVSAGFGEEHYVLKYLRGFRDNVLMSFGLGRDFVDLYYATAPKYARIVYKHPVLRFLMRMVGYSSYVFLNFWKLILFCSGLILCSTYLYRNREESRGKNSLNY